MEQLKIRITRITKKGHDFFTEETEKRLKNKVLPVLGLSFDLKGSLDTIYTSLIPIPTKCVNFEFLPKSRKLCQYSNKKKGNEDEILY